MKESLLVRFLDRTLGVLLCLALSLFRLFPRGRSSELKKILIIELFEMGASVMSVPALSLIRREHPGAKVHILCIGGNRESWALLGQENIAKIWSLDGRSLWRFICSLIVAVGHLRREKFDLVIDFELFMRISIIIGALAGPRRIAGFHNFGYGGIFRGFMLDERCHYNQNAHIARNLYALTLCALRPSADQPSPKESMREISLVIPRRPVEEGALAAMKALVDKTCKLRQRKLIVVVPDVGANLSIRNYPRGSYSLVIQKLLEEHSDTEVLLVGMMSDVSTCKEILDRVSSPRCHNIAGETRSLAELLALLSLSELLICNDNGPIHFAALTGTKTLALFSADSPFVYGPLGDAVVLYSFSHCSPCISALNHKRSNCTNNVCLQRISPSEVALMAGRLLGECPPAFRTVNGQVPYL